MLLDCEKLADLEDYVRKEFPGHIAEALTRANRGDRLEELLEMLGLQEFLCPTEKIPAHRNGKIVVIGDSAVKKDVLESIGKTLGIAKDKFEFFLDYDGVKRYDFNKFEYASVYAAILFGPIPHSASGKGDAASIISNIENKHAKNVIPAKIVRITSNGTLKITKNNFRMSLEKLIQEGSVVVN